MELCLYIAIIIEILIFTIFLYDNLITIKRIESTTKVDNKITKNVFQTT